MRRKARLKLRTIRDLARHLGVAESYLLEVADEAPKLYRSWFKAKPSGEAREIDDPREKLKWVQRRINERILQRIQISDTAIGGVKGKRLRDNVKLHTGKLMVANSDLKDFFPSISSGRVYDHFVSVGCAPDVARILTHLTTCKGRLPQGAPTSTMVANLVAASLDKRMEPLASQHTARYTRWVDDTTLSGPGRISRLSPTVNRIVRQCGFVVNPEKTSFRSSNERQQVTGVIVNEKPNVPKEYRRKLRAALHRCKALGARAVANDLGMTVARLKSSLRGQIAYVQEFNPAAGQKLLAEFQSVEWPP